MAERTAAEVAMDRRAWRTLLLIVLGVTAVRLAYLAWFCPFGLAEDEAHYWEWSRHLDWSYYSKGPGIAWSIALSTWALGDTELGVRVLAPLFGAALALAAGRMGRLLGPGVCLFAGAAVLLAPGFQITSLIMTIDGGYLACWALACLLAHRAMIEGSRPAWPLLGMAVGMGFLFKYTILLLPLGLIAFWLARRRGEHRARVGWSGPAAAVGAFALCALPVVVWNAREGFPTVRHLLGHLGSSMGDIPTEPGCGHAAKGSPLVWVPEYLGMQVAVAGPMLFLGILGAVRVLRSHGEAGRDARMLMVCAAAPILVFYLLVSFVTRGEGNWAIAGMVTLAALAGDEARRMRSRPSRGFDPVGMLWTATVIVGLVAGLGMLRMDWLARLPVIGRAMPVERMMRGPVLAQRVGERMDELRDRTGLEPFVVCEHYGRASQMGFYLPGRPVVYCSSPLMPSFPEQGLCRGRPSQLDLWPDHDLGRLDRLGGRPAVLIGGHESQWRTAFERVEVLDGWRDKGRPGFLGYGFVGFPVARTE
ncbi:MAG: glycosyltransferase family 39 protein [Phycisphaeraceae bacterium]|nr:glycosyltransferase family 39 protein [Phycisphaeraceae bacterium]